MVLDMTHVRGLPGLTDVIMDQTNAALEGLVNDVADQSGLMPPGPRQDHPDGREQLRALGFNV